MVTDYLNPSTSHAYNLCRYPSMWGAGVTQYSVWLPAGQPGDRGSISGKAKGFFLSPVSRPALEPTQPPVQWVPGVLSPGVKRGRDVTLSSLPSSAEVVNE
jgi:hypothetical protein